ncbi:hypothetical protein BKA83DRAFT_4132465 [Pisolithus microcarpus]|nr:hypothetical protein BKA83DRAFT_4132465 [Pisolithus microcarpus]
MAGAYVLHAILPNDNPSTRNALLSLRQCWTVHLFHWCCPNLEHWRQSSPRCPHGCGKMNDRDPFTGCAVTGLYVTPPVHKTHARNDKQLALSSATPSAMAKSRARESTKEQQEEQILASTLFHPGPTDALVSTPYNDAPRVHKPPGVQRDITLLSDCSDKLTDREAELGTPNLRDVESDAKSKTSKSHAILDRVEKQFSRLKKDFQYPSLTFSKDPSSVMDLHPQLAFTNRQQSSNMQFLTHQDQIAMLASEVNIIQPYGDQELEKRRINIVTKLREEQVYLGGIIAEQWQRRKVKCGFISEKDSYFQSRISQFPMPFINTLIIVAVMYLLMGISWQGANFLLCTLQDLVTATCTCMLDALGCAAVTSRFSISHVVRSAVAAMLLRPYLKIATVYTLILVPIVKPLDLSPVAPH